MDSPFLALPLGPFSRTTALRAGVTSRTLRGAGFARVYPRVWRRADHEMTDADWAHAARLALPERAQLTGISRIQELGLDYGPRRPVHFVVSGDLHLAFDGVFLHRTKALPPLDGEGVCAEAAFLSYCVWCRVVDAIKVGDWLLRNGHMSLAGLIALAEAQLWRDGALEALWVSEHLDAGSWSLKESETRAVLTFAGLPRPECNQYLDLDSRQTRIGDLLYREHRLVVEYEGRHHQEARGQYTSDVDRYAAMRASGHEYVQVTHEKLQRPRRVVEEVHAALVRRGYQGPQPLFGDRWRVLFGRLRPAIGPRDRRAVG